MRYLVKSREGTPVARWGSLMDCQLWLISKAGEGWHDIDWSIVGDHELGGFRGAPWNDTRPIVYIEIQEGRWADGQLGQLHESRSVDPVSESELLQATG